MTSYNAKEINIQFTYEHPLYISVGKADTMKITYYNTEAWINPLDSSKESIPSGYI